MTRKQKKILFRILSAAVLLGVALAVPAGGVLRLMLFAVPYLLVGYDVLQKAAQGIGHGQVFNENFLMAVATLGAVVLALVSGSGDYTEAVAVMLFYQVGELFQSYAVGRSRRNITALMDIRPDTARVETAAGETAVVDPSEVAVGSLIVVQPGEKIPLDGVVVEGHSMLDTAALTGESLPREAGEGATVVSGCINKSGVLRIRTTCAFGESTVSKILDLVENASSRKAQAEEFIARFARVYTPAVCYAALALALFPPLVQWGRGASPETEVWVYRALTFLVMSCPCALVISVPLTFFAAIGGASRAGILVKGAHFLETLSRVRLVAFDKTGTLTRGEFGVQEVHGDRRRLLDLAAHAECASSHPLARSLAAAYGRPIDRARVRHIHEVSGQGVTAVVDDLAVAVGSEGLMRQVGAEVPPASLTGTVVHLAVQGRYEGAVVLADAPKPTAAAAIAALKKAGVRRTVMLTGDRAAAAQPVADALGLDELCATLLPAGKVRETERLLATCRSGEKLAFVGDGINDAPVLARADVGMAMGALGADAAIEAADVVLTDDDPRKVALALRLARRCMNIVRQNIAFALGIKALCLLLGAMGMADMWLAVFADVGVMVPAVLNAGRSLAPIVPA